MTWMQNWFDAALPFHKIYTVFVTYAHIQCPSGYKNIKYKRCFGFFLLQICTACTNCCTLSSRAVLWWYICLTSSQSWLTSSNHQAWVGFTHIACNGQQEHTSRNLCPATLRKEWVLAICTWDQSIRSSSTKAEPVERKPKMSHWWEQLKCLQLSAFFPPHTDQNHFPLLLSSDHKLNLSKSAWDMTSHILFNKTEFTRKDFSPEQRSRSQLDVIFLTDAMRIFTDEM